ncbi:hypothetical protein, partial [Rhizobium sp.]|uniref:hypothetical protein n=1 Tax=Rhizobium sp. TaxID=391 RepID=UPI0034C69A7F
MKYRPRDAPVVLGKKVGIGRRKPRGGFEAIYIAILCAASITRHSNKREIAIPLGAGRNSWKKPIFSQNIKHCLTFTVRLRWLSRIPYRACRWAG